MTVIVTRAAVLGSFLFSCSRLDDAIDLQRQHPGVTVLWIHDDVFVVGPPQLVGLAQADWANMVHKCHGNPKLPKCKVYSSSGESLQHPAVIAMGETGVQIQPIRRAWSLCVRQLILLIPSIRTPPFPTLLPFRRAWLPVCDTTYK
jgi:hypothetical protein